MAVQFEDFQQRRTPPFKWLPVALVDGLFSWEIPTILNLLLCNLTH